MVFCIPGVVEEDMLVWKGRRGGGWRMWLVEEKEGEEVQEKEMKKATKVEGEVGSAIAEGK